SRAPRHLRPLGPIDGGRSPAPPSPSDRAHGARESRGPRYRRAGGDDRGPGGERPAVHPTERRGGRRPRGRRPGDPALAARVTSRRRSLPGWFVLTLLAAVGANALASVTTRATIELMRSPSPFAQAVRAYELLLLPCFQAIPFVVPAVVLSRSLWPIVTWFRAGAVPPPGILVQRRVISAPLVMAGGSFAAWIVGPIFFPLATLLRFGRWTPDLASQQVLSPLVNGF